MSGSMVAQDQDEPISHELQVEALQHRLSELEETLAAARSGAAAQADALDAIEQERKFSRVLLENLAEGVVAADAEGRLRLFNRVSRQWHGLDASAELPDQWTERFDLYRSDGVTPLPTAEIPLFRALQGEHVRGAEMTIVVKGGEPRLVIASGDPLINAEGRQVGAVVVMHDVTAERRAIEQLQTSEAELRAIFAAMDKLIVTVGRAGDLRKIAPSSPPPAIRIGEEQVGKHLRDTFLGLDADALLTVIATALDTNRITEHEIERPVGVEPRWLSCLISPMSSEETVLVVRDISERRSAEEALHRSRTQEEIIRMQRAALAELSTPLCPITDDIILLPLVGALDVQRADQIMEALTQGICERRASTAIIDVTGVPVVDTIAASALLRVAQAVRLLGAQVILTGIRPEVARTIVMLGIDLSNVTIQSSLNLGIACAMRDSARR